MGEGLLAHNIDGTKLELESCLKASAEVLVEESVDDGVDTAVEEGQPVSKGVHIDINDTILVLSQAGVVAQHHQSPQRQPRQNEEQSNDDKHHDHPLLLS